ncbi:MAG TPA: DNA mismatch repair endonuclease MutL [Bacteroidetes bacterium]|nr:DNA mismatch repair endonuclease MutL [Bacteroidota bacterium]HCN36715.1 DNA mismatch repair endonuclease MutL [Bacteroidota bacterium]
MKNNIKILSQALSNKIAAGEVVNRPESVVKELIENSLDAGATDIHLIIKDAGKSLIQVIDNGYGMNEDDAKMSFMRHSTSKINEFEDLENLMTLGFRGEALASICSVAQIEMKTKTGDEDLGTLIRIEGNEFIEVSKTSCEKGTSIAVKNLFYNTPGRRNFLKSNHTEFKHIYETFIKIAVSKPEISFTFYNNDEKIFDLKKETLINRIRDIFTERFAETLIPVNYEHSIIKLNGYISKPTFTKKAKQDQYLFLNGRMIYNRNLNFAVYSGYDDLIDKGDYPSFFLFIDIIPSKVDVNVHPSKHEVKFEDESAVFGFVRKGVKEALKKADLIFEVRFEDVLDLGNTEERLSMSNPAEQESKFNFKKNYTQNNEYNSPKINSGAKIHSILEASKLFTEKKEDESKNEDNQKHIITHKSKPVEEKFNIWQYNLKYILCQTETGLMIIDQHAAHERVLYEKAYSSLEAQSSFSQQLLIPVRIELTNIDFKIAEELKNELQNLGFNFVLTKNNFVELTGLPSDVRIGNEEKIFQELLDQYKDYELKLNLEKRDNLAKSYACRSAIKSGDRLTIPEMTNLIDNLFACKMPYVCPHGRPTVIRITTEELDRRFSRT